MTVGKILGDVRREEDEVRAGAIAFEVFAADATGQFRQVVLLAYVVGLFFRLLLAFFIVFSLALRG